LREGDYIFRETDVADYQRISDLLTRCDFGPKRPEWLRWKYLDNPLGRARVFVIENSSNKELEGLVAFEPRLFQNGDATPFVVMHAVEGFLKPEIRGKGLYPQLLQHAMTTIDAPMLGFPNKRAERIHIQCGWQILSTDERWYFPVAAGNHLKQWPLRILAPLVNFLSRAYATLWLGREKPEIQMKSMTKAAKDYPARDNRIQGVRSAAFLNWRFINNPMRPYSAYEFFENGESVGYCVYALDGKSAELFDFSVERHSRTCLRMLVEHCRKRGITHLLFRGSGLALWKFGFVKWGAGGSYIAYNLPQGAYYLTFGDSDW